MFWVVDNFLMRKQRKIAKESGDKITSVKYNSSLPGNSSDDEVVLHSLISNEAQDHKMDTDDYSSDHIHRRHESRSS